ncbi:hypothetical protein J1N35_006807 [Gossypium stocksii]|uniref:Uncharacterized protein n=1 Tax=Gossypium stocksii TaxID=47602 RepID=A0A9D4AEN2_9ROSI|nr:hypothetical protein J1N35_006807 [Gossypium stocksii]
MLGELRAQNERLDKKLKSLKTWRMVSNALFFAAFVSVMAAALSMKPVVTALASALTVAVVPAWKWCDGRWKRNVEKVKQQKLTTRMKHNVLLHTTTIDIRAFVTNLEEKIKSQSKSIHVVL